MDNNTEPPPKKKKTNHSNLAADVLGVKQKKNPLVMLEQKVREVFLHLRVENMIVDFTPCEEVTTFVR